MANTKIAFQELRMDVRDPDFTHVYVFVENLSRDGFPIEGWHYKAFPASMSTLAIMEAWAKGEENPLMWGYKTPPR